MRRFFFTKKRFEGLEELPLSKSRTRSLLYQKYTAALPLRPIMMILRDVSIRKPGTQDLAKINPVEREKDG